MEEYPENQLKKLCCTCLNKNCKLFQLCRLKDGVNNYYSLLFYDSEAYREGFFRDSANLYVCWICQAMFRRIAKFRRQACQAQKILTSVTDGKVDINSLSTTPQFSHFHKSTYDVTITYDHDDDNFIICGITDTIKSDDDDVPLADLQNDFRERNEVNCVKNNNIRKNSKGKVNGGLQKNRTIKDNTINSAIKNDTIGDINDSAIKISAVNNETIELQESKDVITESGMTTLESFQNGDNIEVQSKSGCKKIVPKSKLQKPSSTKSRKRIEKLTSTGCYCGECDKYFDNKNQKWKHVQRHHREGYKCVICQKRFAFRSNLSRHELLHKAPPSRTECSTCNKMVRTDLLKQHARIHTKRESFSCVTCCKQFVSRASYEHHLKYTQAHAAVDILKYKCSECDRGYRSRGELRDHVNYQHMGKTQHKCPVCGKALATRRCITRHVRRAHDGLKENTRDKICQLCGKAFRALATRRCITRYVRRAHDGLKENTRDKICQLCGKAFRDKKGLREHESIHTGERPLSCEMCGRTFRQSASLYTHRKRVHNVCPTKKSVELVETI